MRQFPFTWVTAQSIHHHLNNPYFVVPSPSPIISYLRSIKIPVWVDVGNKFLLRSFIYHIFFINMLEKWKMNKFLLRSLTNVYFDSLHMFLIVLLSISISNWFLIRNFPTKHSPNLGINILRWWVIKVKGLLIFLYKVW